MLPSFAVLIVYALAALALVQPFDPSVSNGTCYYDTGQVADNTYIPCGNDALGHQTCCQARDICLSSKACYNGKWGVTYLAGCTDIDYANLSVCPEKNDYHTQQWVGLVRCFEENNTSSRDERWAGCEDTEQPLVANPDHCTCAIAPGVPGFWDAPALTDIASLPVSAGNLIAWYDGFTPFNTLTLDEISRTSTERDQAITSSFTRQISTIPPVITSSATVHSVNSNPADHQLSDLSISAKAGIGVGCTVGFVTIICLLAWCRSHICRKPNLSPSSVLKHVRPRSQIDPLFHNKENDLDTNYGLRSPAWSGNKSELPADEPRSSQLLQSHYPQSLGKGDEGLTQVQHDVPKLYREVSDINQSRSPIHKSKEEYGHVNASKVYELPG